MKENSLVEILLLTTGYAAANGFRLGDVADF